MTALPKRIKDATGKTPEAMDLNFNLNPARSLPWGREAEKILLASFGRRRQGSRLALNLQKMRNGIFASSGEDANTLALALACLLPYPVCIPSTNRPTSDRKINGRLKAAGAAALSNDTYHQSPRKESREGGE